MKKTLLNIIALAILSLGATAQNVNIPDANFKAYLVGNPTINTNSDTEIQINEAAAFTGAINCQSLNISDLTGIEAFTAATELRAYANNLSSLDISSNTALSLFSCSNNSISVLDLSNNTALTNAYCSTNLITSLDLSNNTLLTALGCTSNQLTSLNVANGNNSNFTQFDAINNPNLTCIEVDDVTWSITNWTVSGENIDATASFSINCSVGIDEQLNNINFSVYPIPTTGNITIDLSEFEATNVSIINSLGIAVFKAQNVTQNKLPISLTEFSNGVYFVKIQSGNEFFAQKIIKQ